MASEAVEVVTSCIHFQDMRQEAWFLYNLDKLFDGLALQQDGAVKKLL